MNKDGQKGPLWAQHLPPTVLLHVLMQQPPLFWIWIWHYASFMERIKVVWEFRCSFFFYKSLMDNPISPTFLLFCPGQWDIFLVWFCWPPDERKFKFQSQPINPSFPYTSNITLKLGKCLFKIYITIGVPISEGWRGNLPSVLTTFQSCLLMYGNPAGTSRNNPFL